jgi:hypothetical protein
MATNMFRSKSDIVLKRRLRVYSVDPGLASRIGTRDINEIVVEVPWEAHPNGDSKLRPGPVGEYVEVVDFDPPSGVFYLPVDLDDPKLLASDGLAASESDPRFHQQMVYAVAMATIHRFQLAFGRPIFWSNRIVRKPEYVEQFVRRLRIYPHALRTRNAYYSPTKKALLLGYFPVTAKDSDNTPGTTVFTCLSHDIVAHEITHALLDGIHPRFNEPSNPDVHAFHEAFADLVALLQRFSYPGVLEREIAKTRGDLGSETMLAQLASQFGKATGHGSSLRDALGGINKETGKWQAKKPDPLALEREIEPHKRGSYLVAAVFRAFTLVYSERVADLYRISTQGTGVLPEGDIHPDLTRRLAREARDTAAHILQMCIRAIDYCPPVDITFGDYLRAVITADLDIDPNDEYGYRIAFVESFRLWGIHPQGIRSMSVESLRWPEFPETYSTEAARLRHQKVDAGSVVTEGLPGQTAAQKSLQDYLASDDQTFEPVEAKYDVLQTTGARPRKSFEALNLRQDRFELWKQMEENGFHIWRWLNQDNERDVVRTLGLIIDNIDAPPTVYRNRSGNPTLEVHSIRPIVLNMDDFGEQNFLIVEVLQRRRGYLDPNVQKAKDTTGTILPEEENGDFIYRAGCTFFINPGNKEIHWVIRTAGTIASNDELDRMRGYLTGDNLPNVNEFAINDPQSLGLSTSHVRDEPFALLHDQSEG